MKPALLLLLWTMWYLAFSTRTVLAPFLPMIKNEFAISHATSGALLIFISIGQSLGYFCAGTIASRIGAKILVVISFVSAAAALAGIYLSSTYFVLSVWLFVFGLCGGLYLPCAIPILTAAFDHEHWGKAISFHETAAGFSILTIPYLAAFFMALMPWRSFFLILAAAFTMIIPVFWITSPDTRTQQSRPVGILITLKRPELWMIMALWTISAMGAMGIYSVLPLFLVEERSMTIETANRILSATRIGGLAGQIGIGFFLDRYDTGKTIIILILGMGLASLGLGIADVNAVLIVLLFLQATFSIVFFPVGIVAISRLTTLEERGIFAGIVMGVSTVLGLGVTPFFLGFIADIWHFQPGFILLGLITLGGLILAFQLKQRLYNLNYP